MRSVAERERLNRRRPPAEYTGMTFSLTVGYLVIGATLLKAALVQARVLPPTCGRCGLAFERRYLGERVCTCHL